MPLTDSEPFRQPFHAVFIPNESAIRNQSERARNRIRRSAPGREIRRGLRAAPQARTVSCLLRRGRRTEKFAIHELRRSRRADRAAVDPCAFDAREQKAVKSRVPALQRAVTGLLVRQLHEHIFAASPAPYWRFSDMTIFRIPYCPLRYWLAAIHSL